MRLANVPSDTTTVFELMRPVPDPGIASWVSARAISSRFLTAVTEVELHFGLAVMPPERRGNGLVTGLERTLNTGFENPVLALDRGAARLCRDWRHTVLAGSTDCASRLPDCGDCLGA